MDDDCKSHSAGRFRIESGDLEGSDEVRNCVITVCKTNTLQMVKHWSIRFDMIILNRAKRTNRCILWL